MIPFNVTWERVNAREAEAGGTARHGMLESGISLRDALQVVRNETPAASETRGTWANDSRPECARWVSAESECWESGDSLTLAIHFPDNATPASRARLCRFLGDAMR